MKTLDTQWRVKVGVWNVTCYIGHAVARQGRGVECDVLQYYQDN